MGNWGYQYDHFDSIMRFCQRHGALESKENFRKVRGYYAQQCNACVKAAKQNKWANPPDNIPGRATYLLGLAKERADEKGLPFTLTEEWLIPKLEKATCEAVGSTLHLVSPCPLPAKRTWPWSPSLDRKQSHLGYVPENTQVTSWAFNQAKSTYTEEALHEMFFYLVRDRLQKDAGIDLYRILGHMKDDKGGWHGGMVDRQAYSTFQIESALPHLRRKEIDGKTILVDLYGNEVDVPEFDPAEEPSKVWVATTATKIMN